MRPRLLKRMISERTGANPFFMEETVQGLLDEGALVRDGVAVRLSKPLAELKIPGTVQAILAARIDRLPAEQKELLQTLAVLGKEFGISTLSHLKATAAARRRVGLSGCLALCKWLSLFTNSQRQVRSNTFSNMH